MLESTKIKQERNIQAAAEKELKNENRNNVKVLRDKMKPFLCYRGVHPFLAILNYAHISNVKSVGSKNSS